MAGVNGELDHSKLDPFVKGEPNILYPKKRIIEQVKEGETFERIAEDKDKEPIIQETRDIGATLSCLVEVAKDLTKRIEAIENK
jgi:hypothetical protein